MSAPPAGTALFIAPCSERSSEMYLMLESLLIKFESCPWDIVQRYPLTSPRPLPLPAPKPLATVRSVDVGGGEYFTSKLTVALEGRACRSRDNFEDCAALHDAVSSTSRTA